MTNDLFGKLCTNFGLFRWFTVGAESSLKSLHHVYMGSIFDVSEVRAASIFRVELSRVSECSCVQ
jgi:hypothetical protein